MDSNTQTQQQKQPEMQPSTVHPVIRKRIPKSQRRRDGLIQYAKDNNKTSQNGEDGIIKKIFELLPSPHWSSPTSVDDSTASRIENETKNANKFQRSRWCVDVGAWDGKHLSNTYSLLTSSNDDDDNEDNRHRNRHHRNPSQWRGVLIEADEQRFQELEAMHRRYGNICINAIVSSDPTSSSSLVALLKEQQRTSTVENAAPDDDDDDDILPNDFDFLSIDVDGSDYWILNDVLTSKHFLPKVICVEFNPTMDNDLIYIPPRNDNIRHGASLAALVELADGHGYVLVETTLFNAFFVQNDLYQRHLKDLVPDTSIEALHETTMGTSIYQLYDGTIKVDGCKKLLWHRVAIDEKKIQILSPQERNFPFAPKESGSATNDDHWMSQFNDQVIDMSPYCQEQSQSQSHNEETKMCCALSLMQHLQTDGFALVRGTGIPQELCRDALQWTHSFLQDAQEDVRRSCLAPDRARRGYSPINTENFASLIGDDGPNDLVRKFRVGPPADETGQQNSLLQPNVWPTPAVWDEMSCHSFKSTVEQYYNEISSASACIVDAICDGLVKKHSNLVSPLTALRRGCQENYQTTTSKTTSILTLLGYRTGSRHKKAQKKRHVHPLVAAHTDVGVITMLLFDGGTSNDSCAVLQRQVREDGYRCDELTCKWADVTLPAKVPDDPVFVINIADCLSALSRQYLPSTLHRVWPSSGLSPRNCLALFVGLDPKQILQMENGEVSYEVWRKNRIAESQEVIEKNKKVTSQ